MGKHGDVQLNLQYQQPHPGYDKKFTKYLPKMGMTSEQQVLNIL